jgi:hypothetical protein
MFNPAFRFFEVLRDEGLLAAYKRSLNYLFHGIWVRRKIFQGKSSAETFESIYETNYWSSEESVSGVGSEMFQTKNIREHLPIIFQKFECNTIFDGPCGDFSWMRTVLKGGSIKYIGGDIVGKLITKNNELFGNENIQFREADICKSRLPDADLMICRDCLFHLSYSDIRSFFLNFSKSKIPYLLVTTHIQTVSGFRNRDIQSGDFRMLDLFSYPFNLKRNVLYRFDDYQLPEPRREMIIITRQTIAEALANWSST